MSDYALVIKDPRLINLEADAGEVLRGESRTELVERLMPGYVDSDKDASRFFYLLGVAHKAQGLLVSDAVQSGDLTLSELDQEQVDALLNTPRDQPVEWGEWDLPVPLVVIPQAYDGRPVPTGNVVKLDGHDETRFLASLEELGAVEVFVRA